MYIKEVLQLNKVSGSIKKIDLFLAECDKSSTDYYVAFAYRAIIMHSIGKTNEALKALYSTIVNYSYLNDDSIVAICDAIIEITMEVNRLDQTKKYIEMKKRYLKVSKSSSYTKDMINYHLASNDYSKATTLLLSLLSDELSNDEKIWSYENLAKIYYKEYQYDKYLDVAAKLEILYQDILNMKALQDLATSKLVIYYDAGNYVRVICDGNAFLNEFDASSDNKIKVATLLIRSYLNGNEYRKASIIESNYEEYLSSCTPNIALGFAKAALELYTKTNSLVSIQQYQGLINTLSREKNVDKNKKKNNQKSVIIPNISTDEIDEHITPILERVVGQNNVTSIKSDIKEMRTVYISKMYEQLSYLFNTLNSLDNNSKFREIFRITGIELSKIIPIKDMYIVTYQNGYSGIHYKKERAYDKQLTFEDLENTINFLAINYEQEIYLDPESVEGLKNIISKENYDNIPYGVSFPLFKEDIVFASIAYFSDEPFLQTDMTYEILKLISQMLNSKLIAIIKQNELEINNRKMFFLYENMKSGVKEVIDDHIHLSKQAVAILGCLEDMVKTDFESHIHSSDLAAYRSLINEILMYLSPDKYIEYRFKKNGSYIKVKESFYPSYKNGIISIYSIIEDISEYENTKNELVKLAYTHPLSKLNSELKLMMDIKDALPTKKFSLVLLDVKDFKLYSDLYGINFSNQLVYAIAKELTGAFENEFNVSVYHIDRDRYALLCNNINDRRVIDALLKKKLDKISKNLKLLNNRLSVYFNCGVYRIAKSSPNLDEDKIISYANDALTDAKDIVELSNNISHYDSERAKLRFNENQLITHISEAIDHGRIGISYKQVVDVKNNEIFAYYANLSLDNYEIDESYMNRVIKRRGLEELLDKYAISNISKELKMLYDSLKAYVPIMIKINDKSLDLGLISFIEQQDHFFHSTKKNMIFIFDDANNPIVNQLKNLGYKIASTNLMNLYQGSIDIFIFDAKELGFNIVKEINELCNKKNCTLVVGGIDTKEELEIAIDNNIDYLYGKYYRKSIRIKKLIEKNSK